MGYARTALLLAGMTALFLGVGYMLGGEAGMMIALVFAAGMNLFTYWNADKMVLGMYGAREISRADLPWFHDMIQHLAERAELPMPKVYLIEQDQPNAFATGRNPENAAVAATRGLLERMNREEVAGVMAHELAHVKNRDTLIMTITATIAGAISMLANFALFFGNNRNNPLGLIGTLAMMFLAPMAAMLGLASALGKLEKGAAAIDNHAAERNPATAHMFIINPLHANAVDSLFSTHPNTQNRIAALQRMAGAANTGRGPLRHPRSAGSPHPYRLT